MWRIVPAAASAVSPIFGGTMALVIGITIYVGKKTSGEISEFGAHRSLWRL